MGEPLEGGALLLSVCRNAGACLKRDGIDTLLLGADGAGGQLATKAGTIIDSPDEIGSWPLLPATVPPADLDHDGIPDDKEPPQAHAWDRPWKSDQRNALLDDNGNGQTNLDEYLANLVQDLSPSDNP